jgi:hypothetical protein
MRPVDRNLPRPDADRVSALTALVILAYTLVRVVDLPALPVETAVAGLILRLEVNTRLIMITLAAALAVVGTQGLVRSHPRTADRSRPPFEHTLIPALAALGVGIILTRLPQGPPFWIGLGLGATLIVAVLLAEFISVDPGDPRAALAALGLSWLSFLLLSGAVFAVRATGQRAAFAIPWIALTAGAVAWRTLRLEIPWSHRWVHAVAIGGAAGQIGWALHYWPISPWRYALLLTLLVYAATRLTSSVLQGDLTRTAVGEVVLVGAAGLGLIFFLG